MSALEPGFVEYCRGLDTTARLALHDLAEELLRDGDNAPPASDDLPTVPSSARSLDEAYRSFVSGRPTAGLHFVQHLIDVELARRMAMAALDTLDPDFDADEACLGLVVDDEWGVA